MPEPLTPVNMDRGRSERGGEAGRDTAAILPDRYYAKALSLALDAAGRVVRREATAVARAAKKCADDPQGWAEWVGEFYRGHREEVAEQLRVPLDVAGVYCDGQARELLAHGAQVAETWERERPPQLAAIMLGGAE